MRLHVFVVTMILCLALALLPPIGSKKAFSENALPSLAVKALTLPAGYTIPPQDKPCILPGDEVDIACLILNDPDFARVRAEEAGLEAQALVAAKSGSLDPFHAVQTLGELEIFDPNLAVNDPNNENMTIGDLGLTSAEENDLVAFLESQTDGYVPTPSPESTPASTIRKPATPPGR